MGRIVGLVRWIRHEISWRVEDIASMHRSLPNPPEYEAKMKERKAIRDAMTFKDKKDEFLTISRDFWADWKTSMGIGVDEDLEKQKLREETERSFRELGAAAGHSAKTAAPILQDMIQQRAKFFKQAVAEFIRGYREGLSEPVDNDKSFFDFSSTNAPSASSSSAAPPTPSASPSPNAQQTQPHNANGHQ